MGQRKIQGLQAAGRVVLQEEKLPFQVKEAINVLRGNIQLSGYDLKLISVASAVKHEGKSSCALRLAASLSSLEKRVLFLDCDIRKSVILKRYKVQEKVLGLTEYLCGKCEIEDVVYETNYEWMDIIFAGAIAPNPSELISSPRFSELLQIVREEYDYVIVDTPPINAVIEGVLIAKQCDGTILVVESGVTERAQAIRMKHQLEYADVKMLGVVLNKIGAKKNLYGYGYGYGYGYKYGYGYGEEEASKKK